MSKKEDEFALHRTKSSLVELGLDPILMHEESPNPYWQCEYLFILDRVSLGSLGQPEIYNEKASLKLTDTLLKCGFKGMYHHLWLVL